MQADKRAALYKLLEVSSFATRRSYHAHLLHSVFNEKVLGEETGAAAESSILGALAQGNLKTTPSEFHESLMKSRHPSMLTHYSVGDLAQMHLFKVPGYNVGYALKKWSDGTFCEIVAVHNNEPSVKGIGKQLMQSAIDNGGCILDHFDGFLSKLYSSMGFIEFNRDKFDPQYDPDGTFSKTYGPVDVIYRVLPRCKHKVGM